MRTLLTGIGGLGHHQLVADEFLGKESCCGIVLERTSSKISGLAVKHQCILVVRSFHIEPLSVVKADPGIEARLPEQMQAGSPG